MSSQKMENLIEIERKQLNNLRGIMWNLSSPDRGQMYGAASKMTNIIPARPLLPITMTLLKTQDKFLRKLVFRTAGRNMITSYLEEFFSLLNTINPAEREQVLQAIEEGFIEEGAPLTPNAQKKWISALEKLGVEHQPTVFGIFASLGAPGVRKVKKIIRDHVETISIGSIPKLNAFDEKTKNAIIKLLCQKASARKPELVGYISEIVDRKSLKYLVPFLKQGSWQDRAEVAKAIGRVGITSVRGLVMDIIADPNWRVKQAMLENLNIAESKFSALLNILSYLVVDSHTRIRSLAERCLLQMGSITCKDSNLEVQRVKLEKKFRKQLLHAASNYKDIDSTWLGIEPEDLGPIPVLSESDNETEGVSLSDLAPPAEEEAPSEEQDLLSALLAAKNAVIASEEKLEIAPTDLIIRTLREIAPNNEPIPLKQLKTEAIKRGLSKGEFDKALLKLEREGFIYRPKEDTIRSTDFEI